MGESNRIIKMMGMRYEMVVFVHCWMEYGVIAWKGVEGLLFYCKERLDAQIAYWLVGM